MSRFRVNPTNIGSGPRNAPLAPLDQFRCSSKKKGSIAFMPLLKSKFIEKLERVINESWKNVVTVGWTDETSDRAEFVGPAGRAKG